MSVLDVIKGFIDPFKVEARTAAPFLVDYEYPNLATQMATVTGWRRAARGPVGLAVHCRRPHRPEHPALRPARQFDRRPAADAGIPRRGRDGPRTAAHHAARSAQDAARLLRALDMEPRHHG